jgi:hypothetical protein
MDHDPENEIHGYRYRLGCGLLGLFLLIGIMGFTLVAFTREREAARFPGAQIVSEHNNYRRFPFHYQWNNSYRTTASFTEVYNWYSLTFDMGAEARANGECITLETDEQRYQVRHAMSVFICGTTDGQLIYVTRGVSWVRPFLQNR